ncbi:MAG: SulP family inorganic anion transporter, partial [Acidimicrobiia bacterium]|nr:SulP family inorganic anion transporter [Acidimicrobiia bacterium]
MRFAGGGVRVGIFWRSEGRPITTVLEKLPIVATLRSYRRSYLRPDLVTGVVLATMLLPQGMAYAELTGLPAVTGIYTTIAALVGYSLFGPNRRLVLGPDSSLAPVIAAVVLPLAIGDQSSAVAYASMLSLLAGLVCIAAGYLRLGVVTELLSKPIRIGYLNGIAVLIFVSQVPKALGFSVDVGSPFALIADSVRGITEGQTSLSAVAVAGGGVTVILLLNRLSRLRPGVVVAAALSIAVVVFFGVAVDTVGDIPSGLPALTFPSSGFEEFPALLLGAVAVALVSFADTGALSTATAMKGGGQVDPNSEIKALGAANLLSGVFQGFATSASSSRTAVAMAVGSKTQVTGLVAAGGVVVLMIAFPDVIGQMPAPTLAAIVMTA